MSGYDQTTGWTHATPRKLSRYYRTVKGQPDNLDERLKASGRAHYWDASGGLHVRCDSGELWTLLSGKPATFGKADEEPGEETEWISVTDIGASLDPQVTSSTVLKKLREAGLLKRVNGRDTPTERAVGLYEERPAPTVSAAWSKEGATQRRWAYQVVVELRGY